MDIRYFNDPILREKASEVINFDSELKKLVNNLFKNMYKYNGVGLSAPQLGESVRVFVYDNGYERGYLINPEITFPSLDEDVLPEGCLSIPNISANIKRRVKILAEGKNIDGDDIIIQGSKFLSKIIQHEVDHLNGVLFIDHLPKDERDKLISEIINTDWYKNQEIRVNPHK